MSYLPEIQIVEGKNRYLVLNAPDLINSEIRRSGDWGALENCMAEWIIRDFGVPSTVLDVGANVGTFTVNAAKCLAQMGGEIHSFEPQRIVFQQLCGNVFLNRLSNVHTHNIAVGEKCEVIEIPELSVADCPNLGGMSIDPLIRQCLDATPAIEKFSATNFEQCKVSCEKRTLDSLTFDKRISLIKIDVEGFEFEVLMGAIQTIKSHEWPTIIYEDWDFDWYAPKRQNIEFLLEELGYTISRAHDFGIAQHSTKRQHLQVVGQNPYSLEWVTFQSQSV